MRCLRHSQLEAVRLCIEKLYALRDPDTFEQELLALLTSVIPSEAGFNEFEDNTLVVSLRPHPLPRPAIEYLGKLGPELFKIHPILKDPLRTGSEEPLRLKDCTSLREWRRSALYNECYRTFDCDYQMGFTWGGPATRFGLPMNRSKRDFSEAERQMLCLLRPHLIQAHINVREFSRLSQAIETLDASVILTDRRGRMQYATPRALNWLREYFGASEQRARLPGALALWLKTAAGSVPARPFSQTINGNRLTVRAVPTFSEPITLLLEERRTRTAADLRLLGLTEREAEVLFWVSKGKTNHEVGVILRAATSTIRNHVEHILRKLKVENRVAAAAMALEVLSDDRGSLGQGVSL
jgi:DNA-binding CsgD family transcriptional regulator